MSEDKAKLTAYEFAKRTGLHPTKVMRDVDSGKIDGEKIPVESFKYQIPASEVNKFKH